MFLGVSLALRTHSPGPWPCGHTRQVPVRPLLGRVLYIKIIVKIIRDCEVDLVYNPVPGPLGPFVQKGGYPDTPLLTLS